MICLSFDCYLFCPLPVPGGVYLSGTGVCAAAVAACSVRFIFTASFISGFILSPAVCGSRNIKRREQQQIGEASQTVQCRLGWYTCFHSFFFFFFFLNSSYLCVCVWVVVVSLWLFWMWTNEVEKALTGILSTLYTYINTWWPVIYRCAQIGLATARCVVCVQTNKVSSISGQFIAL